MTTLATADLDIYYEVLGAGSRLLVFNGSDATIASSRVLIDFLAANFTVPVHEAGRACGSSASASVAWWPRSLSSPEGNATPMTPEQREGARLQLEARSHHDVWSRLDRIRCPTLVACGRYDGLAPAANSEAIASRIPGSMLRQYEGGHLFALQDLRAPAEIVSFLSGMPSGRTIEA